MPKLSTTVDNLELKTNKVFGSVPSADWTDTQYPSAKTLYNAYTKLLNITHPIGSILITNTNDKPDNVVGGEWQLIDKGFKEKAATLDPGCWISNSKASLHTYGIFTTLSGNTVSIRIHLKLSEQVTDAAENIAIGKVDVEACGISRFEFATIGIATISDSGNCTVSYNINPDGTIVICDVIRADGTHTIAADSDFTCRLCSQLDKSLC